MRETTAELARAHTRFADEFKVSMLSSNGTIIIREQEKSEAAESFSRKLQQAEAELAELRVVLDEVH